MDLRTVLRSIPSGRRWPRRSVRAHAVPRSSLFTSSRSIIDVHVSMGLNGAIVGDQPMRRAGRKATLRRRHESALYSPANFGPGWLLFEQARVCPARGACFRSQGTRLTACRAGSAPARVAPAALCVGAGRGPGVALMVLSSRPYIRSRRMPWSTGSSNFSELDQFSSPFQNQLSFSSLCTRASICSR
ncbi:hypothetical protein AWB67_05786 [Caballeronia terrestris]|uniref:Uncharacterized protein n=1 Tax=Caballeronia terrestris TaxID=1226301 RepID=A0A158KKX2_9BURK|nr:hypothetical protein AWB67_05786 [Caballeronia terrestris]